MKIFPIQYLSGGQRVRGLGYGPADGIPGPVRVVAIHGYGSSKHRLDNLCTAIAQAGIAVVSIDLPGHKLGASGGVLTHFETAVECALDAVRCLPYHRPPVFLGHSLGAATAVVAASRLPEAVGAISLGLGYPVTIMRDDPAVISAYLELWNWVDGLSPLEAGLGMDAALPEALVRMQGRPYLLVTGDHDRELPPASARTLAEMAGPAVTHITVPTDHSGVVDSAAGVVVDWLAHLGKTNSAPPIQ